MSGPDPGAGPVAVVTALPEEFQAIANVVVNGRRLRVGEAGRGILLKGKIAGANVMLAMTGDGAARAERGVSHLLGESPVSFLVGAGAAGALVPSLRAGQIVAGERVLDEEGETPPPDATLLARAVALGARTATLVQSEAPACSSKEKGAVAVRAGVAREGAAIVDMESAAWARAAASRGVPFLILRAVSDTFEEDLPGFLSSCLSSDGSVDRAAVARRLLLNPSALPALLRTRRRVRAGAAAIALFLERLLPEKI